MLVQKKEEEAQSLQRQLSETHEQEVLLLKEELQTKTTAMTASEEELNVEIARLVEENKNLLIECEKQKIDLTKQ